MIQSLLIAGRCEIACQIIRTHSSPNGGGGPAKLVEGAHGEVCSGVERGDPSARSSGHLPVPGRICGSAWPVPGRIPE